MKIRLNYLSLMKIRLNYVSLMLLGVLVFQIATFTDTLNIHLLGRLVNALILLVLVVSLCVLINNKRRKTILLYYSLPLMLVLLGHSINFIMSLTPDALGQASKLLPYLGALTIPFFRKHDLARCWNIFYVFMLWTAVICIFEYIALFGGFLEPVVIETNRGVFYKGMISILHYAEGGMMYPRFYGVFPEPGTLAMYLIPAIAYALVYSKKLAVSIFLVAIALTTSLGGYVSALIVVYLFSSWQSGRLKYKTLAKVVVALLAALFLLIAGEELMALYAQKGTSASGREDQVLYFFHNFLAIITDKPFGYILVGDSQSALMIDNPEFLGNNFSFFAAFVQGGLLSFVGYTMFFSLNVIVILKYFWQNYDPDRITACAMLSLPGMLIFAFQRPTILESLLFAFLFAVPLLRVLTREPIILGAKI